MNNPISGHLAPGYRFRFRVRSISHGSLFLPLEMKNLPEIKALLQGVSPLVVFKCSDIMSARIAFIQLRQYYDFSYWAATAYRIPDMQSPSNFVHFRLNRFQSHIIDVFCKRLFYGQSSSYVISKSFGPCGLSTCIQAFFFWLQKRSYGNSFTFADDNSKKSMMTNFRFNIHCPSDVTSNTLTVPGSETHSTFFSYRNPDSIRNLFLRYVHLADMAKWIDRRGEYSFPIIDYSLKALQNSGLSIFVMEGNIPHNPSFSLRGYSLFFHKEGFQMSYLDKFNTNPAFIHKIIFPLPNNIHIDLDSLNSF